MNTLLSLWKCHGGENPVFSSCWRKLRYWRRGSHEKLGYNLRKRDIKVVNMYLPLLALDGRSQLPGAEDDPDMPGLVIRIGCELVKDACCGDC